MTTTRSISCQLQLQDYLSRGRKRNLVPRPAPPPRSARAWGGRGGGGGGGGGELVEARDLHDVASRICCTAGQIFESLIVNVVAQNPS